MALVILLGGLFAATSLSSPGTSELAQLPNESDIYLASAVQVEQPNAKRGTSAPRLAELKPAGARHNTMSPTSMGTREFSTEIAAAVAHPDRPTEDRVRDANRKPAETLQFIGVKPGDKIADYASGAGYFTRLFSTTVGASGHVYASVPTELFEFPNIVKGTAETEA